MVILPDLPLPLRPQAGLAEQALATETRGRLSSEMEDAGGFGVTRDSDLWLKVRIDGKEGWMHPEEDFRALGLPQDE